MTSTNIRVRVAAGAFALAAVAAPFAASVVGASASDDIQAGSKCLAWFGNKEDGVCMGYSNGNGVNVGTPGIGIGPGGITTGPLFPGRTYGGDTGF